MISDYKDIEYLEIKQSESDEIIHISRQKGFLEVHRDCQTLQSCQVYEAYEDINAFSEAYEVLNTLFFQGYFCWEINDQKRKSCHTD
jgi:hypothetical protein